MTTPSPLTPAAPLRYDTAGPLALPVETKSVIVATTLVSLFGLAISVEVLAMRLMPGAFRMTTTPAFPLMSLDAVLFAVRVTGDAMVIGGAAMAVTHRRAARPLLLCGAAAGVVAAVAEQLHSLLNGPMYLMNYGGWELVGHFINLSYGLLTMVVVRALLVFVMTRPHTKAAFAGGV